MEILLEELVKDSQLDFSIIDKLLKEESEIKLTIIYESFFENTKYLRDIVSYILTNFGVEEIWVNRFILLSDELNNNAIEYGTKFGDKNILEISLLKNENSFNLDFRVSDSGNGDSPKSSQEMILLKDKKNIEGFNNHTSIRGRGLFLIISKLVDELNFIDNDMGGLTVKVNKEIFIENKKEA